MSFPRTLTEEDRDKIRAEYRPGSGRYDRGNAAELAKRYGIERGTVSEIARGRGCYAPTLNPTEA